MVSLSQTAIAAALSGHWDKAVTFNRAILEEGASDLEALNRLAYALTQLGKIEAAKKIYRQILSLDHSNFIAQKNLEKISSLPKKSKGGKEKRGEFLSPSLFIEEPGKTKTVQLTNLAPNSILSLLQIGEKVFLYPKRHGLEIRDQEKTYLGALPDDLAFRLGRFLKSGNLYQAFVKNIQKNSLSIFIKEAKRGKRFLAQPSFIPSGQRRDSTREKSERQEGQESEEE